MLVFFVAVFNLTGCAILLNVKKDTQDIVIQAEDGGVYVFYVDRGNYRARGIARATLTP